MLSNSGVKYFQMYCTKMVEAICAVFFPKQDLCVKIKFKQNSTVAQINSRVLQSRRHGFEPAAPSAHTDRANSQLMPLFRFWAN